MKLTLKQAKQALQNEINWCLDHPDDELTYEQQIAFCNGVKQAQYIIEKAEQAKESSCVDSTQYIYMVVSQYIKKTNPPRIIISGAKTKKCTTRKSKGA